MNRRSRSEIWPVLTVMPTKPKTFSLYRKQTASPTKRKGNRERQNKRGLHTGSAQWRKLREAVLNEQPLCVQCLEENRLTAATEVDHINNDSHDNRMGNLAGLCKPCHSRKSATEQNGAG